MMKMRNEIKKLSATDLAKSIKYQEERLENIEAVKVKHPQFVEGEEDKVREILSLLYIEKNVR